ncbi:DUF1428 domain-containing protein [Alteromonas sediminis]|uniref:DUF1428 domain-containing protein n=1 Tax=Alteromonas sediminis TaxID=2259342 RepID=A0A3N5Y6A3_9ALTE|nr:DUF1428 domain-containing protein [Alteromonas sediminis]RPJ68853.1 DUF1428 domain-containing protein [Alteromonas sediminis]
MAYIDGFMLAVPNENKEKYAATSRMMLKIWKEEFGMLSAKECWGDEVPDGKVTSMPMAVKCEANETVVFSWSIWPDKATRDEAWAKCEQDERFKDIAMDFDGKRMIFGGFVPFVEVE